MIVDTVENTQNYMGLSRKLDIALNLLSCHETTQKSEGRYETSEAGLYYLIQSMKLLPVSETRWEYHSDYIDIQYAVSGGTEEIGYMSRDAVSNWVGFGNTLFSDDPATGMPVSLRPGTFAVFFPQDAHRPCAGVDTGNYKKLVIKIPAD